jgi:hypothetical protein
MPKYIGYNFTGTANTTVVTSALNGGVTDRKYNSGMEFSFSQSRVVLKPWPIMLGELLLEYNRLVGMIDHFHPVLA